MVGCVRGGGVGWCKAVYEGTTAGVLYRDPLLTETHTRLKTLHSPLSWRSVKRLKKLHNPSTKHFFGAPSDLFCLHLLCPSLVLTDESVEADYHKGLSFCQNEGGGWTSSDRLFWHDTDYIDPDAFVHRDTQGQNPDSLLFMSSYHTEWYDSFLCMSTLQSCVCLFITEKTSSIDTMQMLRNLLLFKFKHLCGKNYTYPDSVSCSDPWRPWHNWPYGDIQLHSVVV